MIALCLAVVLVRFTSWESASTGVEAWVPSSARGIRSWAPGRFSTTTVASSSSSEEPEADNTKRVVVIGNGMVGQRFMEKLLQAANDQKTKLLLSTFCEEPRAAYNRVKLTSYFETRDPSALSMTGDYDASGRTSWFDENGVQLYLNDRAVALDTAAQTVTGQSGQVLPYDVCVLATGSFPFVPPIPGKQRPGVFVYRTVEDLEAMLAYAQEHKVQQAAVIGGGLLGLEAAKAVADMGLASHIIEFAPILMCRQIDQGGHDALVGKIEAMGLQVHCNARTEAIVGTDGSVDAESMAPVAALRFSNEGWDDLPVQMVVVSAGIKPRDDLARQSGTVAVGERGGVVVNSRCQTSVDNIYAVGEIALYNNFIYGLIAPGYTMAEVAAKWVAHDLGLAPLSSEQPEPAFTGADMSTKLKLLGCDVASFGVNQPKPDDPDVSELVWNDPFTGVYRKLIFNKAGTRLRGGILVGDASDYDRLHSLAVKNKDVDLTVSPSLLLAPASAKGESTPAESDAANLQDPQTQICSCNDVSLGAITAAVKELGVEGATLKAIKKCTKAGTGCGGCEPQVKAILKMEVEKLGGALSNHLCEHFAMSRPELMALVRTDPDPTSVDSFEKILHKHGHGDGCEICKPTVASILASLNNQIILDDGREALQDTNDRALANMQRGGSYSVVPRVPGGELLPDQLIALGEVAKKYNLYTKITGAQRVDLFGAAKHELPDIWEELGEAGFESGHAYGKALRTVKSCVGSTWCRYGVQDSVSFAIRVENRYKGIRSPHKMKSAVSGCVRECAEAQGKDFGMIATENGYNLYVGGNGGADPVHAQLLAADIDEETVLKYLDRYIMYYILTADRLERTAVWQSKLPSGKNGGGPIEHLREVIIEDSLGICAELDRRMEFLVDTYHDEWAEVVKDPSRRAKFKQFANTDQTLPKESMIEFVDIRGQQRPADWPKDGQPQTLWQAPEVDIFAHSEKSWVAVGSISDFAPNQGTPILVGDTQLSVFRKGQNEWFCAQNMCPHKQAFVLSQGIVGDAGGIPKVACPLHKKQFSLDDGEEIGDGSLRILTFPVQIQNDEVMVELPAIPELDAILGTHGLRVLKSDCIDIAGDALKEPLRRRRVAASSMNVTMQEGQELMASAMAGNRTSAAVI